MDILEKLDNSGAICTGRMTDTELEEVYELEKAGLIIRVDKLPECHPKTLNPSYTYVVNNEFGKKLAREQPLFTLYWS